MLSATSDREDAPVRVASFQMSDIQDELPRATDAIRTSAHRANQERADIALFPECFLTGYTRDRTTAEARSMSLNGQRFQSVLHELVDCAPVLIFGLIETIGRQLFNTAVLVSQGALIGAYRKRHPNEGCFEAGTELPIFELCGARFGFGICADARDAADSARLATAHPDAVLYPLNNMLSKPTADRWRDQHVQVLLQRAADTGAVVISADVVGRRGEEVSYGCTAVALPDGTVAAQMESSVPGMLIFDLLPRRGLSATRI
jgi:predicted amidohydrolase